MAIKLTVESFLAGVRQSGLIDPEQLDARLRKFAKEQVDLTQAENIAQALVNCGDLTDWQSEKLLQGKFKGFLLGRYRLKQLLGRGEMSSIYLAEHVRMKRRCAIKVLPASKVKDTSYLGRFHREAEAVASLDHPNIVRAYDVDMENEAGTEIHFLVMEYVEGTDLEKMREKEAFPVTQAAEYIRQAAEGLAHAHENGLIHRDIKPGNLLVDKDGTVKLLDLGLARFFNQTEEESLTIKHDEKVLGTADYLAPEQAVDSHAVDERADIYSLGCTLYFLLAGQPPFTDGTLVQRLLAHQTKAPTPVNKLREDVPESLVRILEKLMAKSKTERYQTAREVADVLGRWLAKHGGHPWREQHPEIVAKLLGIASLRQTAPSDSGEMPKPLLPGSDSRPVPAQRSAKKRKRRSDSTISKKTEKNPLRTSSTNLIAKEPEPDPNATRISPSSFRVPPKKPETWAEFLQYYQLWIIAGSVLLAVFLIAGISASLQATTDDETVPPPINNTEIPNPGLE
ncbi:MAG: serine/threonine protein kinase [Planctomycetaceae bacterium]|nr:serine/threonine protein kinase [Planctomycetaceae bacterium]MCB9949437.1 serine/threonine protein kinase [Planctomycetaceae bacterium]